jgi:hypothetical protein
MALKVSIKAINDSDCPCPLVINEICDVTVELFASILGI